uniref:Uncharacterized protein n=1 Tax=Arundo donax TaxID=35708 RepID=A0A0A9GGD1_ARUDO
MMNDENSDGGGQLSDEILDALECNFMGFFEDEAYISLNAISGTQKHRAIQLRALVQNQVIYILVDSGRSHTFLNVVMVERISYVPSDTKPMTARVANGVTVKCTKEIKNLEWWMQAHTFQVDTKILNIGAYDLILVMDWLEKNRPMNCDWLLKWVEFEHKGALIRLQGVVPNSAIQLTEISGEHLLKLNKGNEIWVIVLLEPLTD